MSITLEKLDEAEAEWSVSDSDNKIVRWALKHGDSLLALARAVLSRSGDAVAWKPEDEFDGDRAMRWRDAGLRAAMAIVEASQEECREFPALWNRHNVLLNRIEAALASPPPSVPTGWPVDELASRQSSIEPDIANVVYSRRAELYTDIAPPAPASQERVKALEEAAGWHEHHAVNLGGLSLAQGARGDQISAQVSAREAQWHRQAAAAIRALIPSEGK